MDARQERGIEIAKQARLRKTPMGGWIVPSQSRGGSRKYAVVVAAVLKVYTTASARRSMSDLREAKERGHIAKLPCHNSVLNALESADTTAILRDLIIESSLPLKAVECDFAVDSSGFTTSRFQS